MRALALISVLLIGTQAQPASAQGSGGCPSCRAIAHFRDCVQALGNATMVRGTAVRVEKARWAGQLQTEIRVAVREAPAPDINNCSLACKLW